MALQPSYEIGKEGGVGARRPVAAAFHAVDRLVLGIPAFLVALVLAVGMFGVGIGLGVVVGFMVFTDAWPLP